MWSARERKTHVIVRLAARDEPSLEADSHPQQRRSVRHVTLELNDKMHGGVPAAAKEEGCEM